jgi:ATP-dependent DNA helicase RecG
LLLDILPSVLDDKQKANKIRNIIYSMSKRDKTIENQGTTRYPQWVLSSSKK